MTHPTKWYHIENPTERIAATLNFLALSLDSSYLGTLCSVQLLNGGVQGEKTYPEIAPWLERITFNFASDEKALRSLDVSKC